MLGYSSRSRDLLGLSFGALAPLVIAIARYRRERRGMATTNFAEAGGFLKTRPDLAEPDVQLHFVVAVVEDHARKLRWGRGMTCHVCALKPKSRGVAEARQPRSARRPADRPGLSRRAGGRRDAGRRRQTDAAADGGAVARAHWTRELFGAAGAGADDEIRAFLRRRVDTVYHPVGTCAMGPDPKTAVVDAQLRVHGLEALRVVDASIMPESSPATPTRRRS